MAGAVAKGAFEAGVLSVLAEHQIEFACVVGASAGSLNGAVYAAGCRRGQQVEAAKRLVKLWKQDAEWAKILSWWGGGAPSARGLSNQRAVLRLLKSALCGWPSGGHLPIEARFVVTRLAGRASNIGAERATTFEDVLSFSGPDFDSAVGNQAIGAAAAASAAFPIVYSPAQITGRGACVDGGIVNNTPIKHALASSADIRRIVVVSPQQRELQVPPVLKGTSLLAHLVDVLINERLFRDLRDAASVNRRLAELTAALGPAQAERVASTLGWRQLEIVEIRPLQPLPGDAFSGFRDRSMRAAYIERGREAALAALPTLRRTPANGALNGLERRTASPALRAQLPEQERAERNPKDAPGAS